MLALTKCSAGADQSPLLGEQPYTEEDQYQRPETVESELKQACCMQQEEHAEADQDRRTGRNFGSFKFLSSTERLPPARTGRAQALPSEPLSRFEPHR